MKYKTSQSNCNAQFTYTLSSNLSNQIRKYIKTSSSSSSSCSSCSTCSYNNYCSDDDDDDDDDDSDKGVVDGSDEIVNNDCSDGPDHCVEDKYKISCFLERLLWK